MTKILAKSISTAPHIAALDDLFVARLEGIDLKPLMIYMIDTVPAEALPYLATQFGVLGYKGWKFADTEEKQRSLIKRAIEIKKYTGTPFAIKEALKILGLLNTQIDEGVNILYDGSIKFDGSYTYGSSWWALFNVIIDARYLSVINGTVLNDIRQLILSYKNERSHLFKIIVRYDFLETIDITETLLDGDVDALNFILYYNITDSTQKSAINQLVKDFKDGDVWNQAFAIWPCVGGTANSHKGNLKAPGTYELVYGGTTPPIHDANGIHFNSSQSQYADTTVVPATHLLQNDTHLSYYSGDTGIVGYYMGVYDGANDLELGDSLCAVNNPEESALGFPVGGLRTVTRSISTEYKVYAGVSVLGTIASNSVGLSAFSIRLGALGNYPYFADTNCRFAMIGSHGVSGIQESAKAVAVQAYQTTLSRQV